MKEQQPLQLQLQHQLQQQQRNSNHANTSSSGKIATAAATAATATARATTSAMMATATQMRATLIYLAPFLHPCKNVVPGTQQQQQKPTTTTAMLSSHCEEDVEVETLQMTHVARNVTAAASSPSLGPSSSSSSCSSSPSSNSSSSSSSTPRRCGSSSCSGNRNVTTTMSRSSTTMTLLHPAGSRNNHNNNAINCNSTIINASKNGNNNNNSRRHCSTTSCSAIRSSCCHNNAAQQQRPEDEKLVEQQQQQQSHDKTKDNTKHKDKYYENYEMPALETTTTMFYASNNKIRQQQQQQPQSQQDEKGQLVVVTAAALDMEKTTETNMKTDNPSLSSYQHQHHHQANTNTTTTTTKSKSSAVTVPVTPFACFNTKQAVVATTPPPPLPPPTTTTATSFVNYTNNRSTKYLRERGRRYYTMQQQQQQQQQDQWHEAYDSTLQQLPPPPAPTGRPLKKYEEFQLHKQQRTTKSPCGRICGSFSIGNGSGGSSESSSSSSSSVSGRLRRPATDAVIDNHNTAKCYNNNQMANTSLLSRCHCLNNMLSNATDKSKDHISPPEERQLQQQPSNNVIGINDNNVRAGADVSAVVGHHNLILRNSSEACNRENEIFYPLNALTTNSTPPPATTSSPPQSSSPSSSSLWAFASSSSSLASSSSSLSSSTSYTTILNKECRCFKSKRDIIIGSEKDRNASLSSVSGAAEGFTSLLPLDSGHGDDSCCLIGGGGGGGGSNTSNSSSMDKASLQHSLSLSKSSTATASTTLTLWSGLWWWWPCLVALFGCSKLTKTVTVSKWLFMWLLFIVLSSSAHCWAGRNDVPTNCTFPARWEGSWFLSGYQQSIHIKGSQFSYRGRCAASDGNKYLLVDEKGCHRCLVIYEKHKNVLQYKESECEGDSMYMHQTNPSAMAMRSVLNQKPSMGNGGDHRGGAHPNLNGHSRLSSSDQYIMRSNDDMNDCPPDFCKGRETLQNLCDQIPGDALLYSLFRESAEPVKCPLKGPFIFTYNRGNGECKSPVSNIESCTEDSRLLLSFQACPDVVGTESTVEELTCLATWKDGNSRYLVGLVSHHHAISNEERYRCFVYEKISSLMDMGHFAGPSMSTSKDAEYKLAQSGDATCNGLDSAEVGSRIMSLRKPPVTERCDFPAWFKGPRHWHVLMGNAVYNYHTNDGSIHIIKPNGYMDTRALCEQINKQTSTEMMSVVHYTTGCQSGFMCMMFYRRDTHIIEIQTGKPASRLEDACAPDHFDINKTPYITLLASNPDPQICPMEGLYTLRGAIGPPYMTTRHKRNHNNKVHGIHNHHHQYESNERGFLHKRHTSLSFRNSNPNERNAWHSNTRGLPGRSRRDASSTTTKPNVTNITTHASESTPPKDATTQEILVVGNSTNVGFVQDPDSDTRLRSRRNVPECITNYKAQRQLWIGCTEPNVIDVRPLCNDEGDEEYSCHGSWTENGTVYIIARHKGTKHGVCISYRPTEGTNAKLVVGDACYRGTQKPPEHHLEANLSVFGKCGETGSTSATIPILSWLQLMTGTFLITLLSQLPIQR